MNCERPGCGQNIPVNRRRYCSDDCSRQVHRGRARELILARRAAAEREPLEQATRSCLGCGRMFLSSGPWNRFCSRCKKRTANL